MVGEEKSPCILFGLVWKGIGWKEVSVIVFIFYHAFLGSWERG